MHCINSHLQLEFGGRYDDMAARSKKGLTKGAG
jgi:hypothetical protein